MEKQPTITRITLPVEEGYLFVETDDILHCQANGNFTHIFLTDDRRLTIGKTLKELETLLPDVDFFRVHHSFLVNLAHARMWLKTDGEQLQLSDGSMVQIARSRRKALRERLKL